MSLDRALHGGRAALRGFRVATGDLTVRKTYLKLAGALFLMTLLLYGLGGWGSWELAGRLLQQPVAFWLLVVACWIIVLLAAPVVALFLVHALFPMFSEKVFLAGLRALRSDEASALADELEAGEGLGIWPSAVISLRRLARFLALTLGVLLLSFIPFLGSMIGPPLQLLLTARMLGGELLDPYLSLRGMLWPEQRAYLVSHRPEVIGYGLPWSLLFAVPLFGPLFFGLAQAGAAVLVAEVLEKSPSTAEGSNQEGGS